MTPASILAAVDQFPQDEVVLARALEVAAANDAPLSIVHVVDMPGPDPKIGGHDTLHGQAALAARDRIEAALTGLGADLDDADIRIEAGVPALRLIEICDDLRPHLIVMRAHQKDRIAERILGSTTDRVIAGGRVPVLVVKRPVSRPYDRVLLATDGTDDAAGALSYVSELLPGAALQLVQAVQIAPQLEEAMLRIGTGQTGLIAHRDDLARTAGENLKTLAEKAPGRVTTRVLRGVPSTVLARATYRQNVDLIAVGPGRTSLIRRAFIGSVTRRLLRDAACDVLICRPVGEDALIP